VEVIRVTTPSFLAVNDNGLYSFGTVRSYSAPVEGTASVDDRNLIAASVPEHLDAVSGFVLVETADAAFYVARVEKFHNCSVMKCKNSKFVL
jgi:hypothetical protein